MVAVCVVLVAAFVATGFVNSAYRREKGSLATLHFDQGQVLRGRGDLAGAAEEFRDALLFSPDSTAYRLSLATVLLDAGKLTEAQSHLDQLQQEDPTNGVINLMLARIAARRHDTRAAIEGYQRAVYEYWPTSEYGRRRQARWELIGLLSATGKRDELIGELLQLYANLPPDPAQRRKVGFLLLNNGAGSEAVPIFRDLLKASPQDAEAHRGLGEAYFSSGDYVQARHEFQRALRSDPHDKASAQQLELTNEVIDLDPALPSISSAERLRRSQNFLSRVIKDLRRCQEGKSMEAPLEPRLQAAQQALTPGKGLKIDDAAIHMQEVAQELWRDKGAFCGQGRVVDRALEAVAPRVSQ
jgi:tetratricopeptide (TPR) repeat protein